MNAAKTLAIATTLSGCILSAGCATLGEAIPQEVRYGKLYSLEASLMTAVNDCDDEDAVFAGRYWAELVSRDLNEHMRFLDRQGTPYRKAEELIESLARVQYSRGEALCEALDSGQSHTRQLLMALAG